MGWMTHRKWKEIKQQPRTAGPGNMLCCCLLSYHFMWDIHVILMGKEVCEILHFFVAPPRAFPLSIWHGFTVSFTRKHLHLSSLYPFIKQTMEVQNGMSHLCFSRPNTLQTLPLRDYK